MSTAGITERIAEASPRFKARTAGFFWLMTIVTSTLALFLRDRLVVTGDAAATAANILAHEAIFRFGSAAHILATCCYVAATLLVYDLLKPVNRSLSLTAAFFGLVGCAVGALSGVFDFALLRGAQYLSVLKVEQLQALALMFLRLRAQANNIGLVFFGFHCLMIGYLIVRSTFLPRTVGALIAFAGVSWLTFLSPPLANYLSTYVMVPSLLGEVSLTVWLLVMGVNVQRWREQASAAQSY